MPVDLSQIKILCLSFHTPPAVRPQAILFNKMVKEFLIAGLKPVIGTRSNEPWEIGAPVVYLLPERFKALNRLPVIYVIKNWLYTEKLYRQLKKIVQKNDIRLVFSFSNPQITNILGALLKKRLGTKFISHFSDPWYNSPLRHDPFLSKIKIGRIEKFIMKQSDMVIFTNENARHFIMSRYPASWKNKTAVIPHCYSEADYLQKVSNKGEKYILSHVGVFYEQRNPRSFFEALSLARKIYPVLPNKLEVRLIGCADNYTGYSLAELESSIKNNDLKDLVKILPRVSFEKSIKVMLDSDCLLVIDPDLDYSPFLPSKLIDYAGSKKTIVGITPENSPTQKFLSQAGYKSFTHKQTEALADYLIYLASKRHRIEPHKDFIEKFEAKNTAQMFLEIFYEVNKL